MRVGLLGLGTVGSAVGRRLVEEQQLLSARAGVPIELAAVAVRDLARVREVDLGAVPLTTDAAALAADPAIDILIEVIGGVDPAAGLIETALRAGRGVVTANKAVIAREGPRLAELARQGRCPLRFEAAVGAGTPMVGLVRDQLLGDRLQSLCGVLNGTTNYILHRMAADGITFAAALSAAQSLGYAEADPSADVDGEDAASKLAILSWLGFGSHVAAAEMSIEGIRGLDMTDVRCARELGFVVKLIARAQAVDGVLAASVRPTLVPIAHPLATLEGSGNGLVLVSDLAGRLVLTGAGAGGDPTASAIVGDVVAAARDLAGGAGGGAAARTDGPPPADPAAAEAELYLRIAVADDPDAAATVALMLEDRGVRVEGSLMVGGDVIILTRPTPRGMAEHALETLDTHPVVTSVAAALDRLPGTW